MLASNSGRYISVTRLEMVYELAYLRVFNAWEEFLEQTFIRYMCGYENSIGAETPTSNFSFCRYVSDAKLHVLNGRQYKLWHNPDHAIKRSQHRFLNGTHERVLSSHHSRLENFSAIRHRIAHAQDHAAANFDLATMRLNGRRYPASRPGRFLREKNSALPLTPNWLESIANELVLLAGQIVP